MMTIACPTCREQFGLPPALAGNCFSCACGAEMVIPRPEDIHRPGPSLSASAAVQVPCVRCSRVLRLRADALDGWITCPSCELVFTPAPPVVLPLPNTPRYEVEVEEREERPDEKNWDDTQESQTGGLDSEEGTVSARDVQLIGYMVIAALALFLHLWCAHKLLRAEQRLQVAILGAVGTEGCFLASTLLFRLAWKYPWWKSAVYGIGSVITAGCCIALCTVAYVVDLDTPWMATVAVLAAIALGAGAIIVASVIFSQMWPNVSSFWIMILLSAVFPPLILLLGILIFLGCYDEPSTAPVGRCSICGRTARLVTSDICYRCGGIGSRSSIMSH